MADDEKRDASSSSSSEEEQIEMVKMDNPAPKLPNPQRIMSTTDVAKYDELLLNMRKYKSQHNIPDMSGATIQLKNVSFELDVPVGGSVKTMTHSLRPKDHIKSFKSLFQKEKEPKTVTKQILKNVSLTIKPKTMTLLLGPPGCGRSTLLKLIARLAVKGRMSGELLINGQNPHKRAHHHYVSYVTQDDNHLPTFKVYQTAYFASLLLGKPELSNKEKMARADELLKQLGLDHRRDTIIGNDYIRGLSGGERKRMTIAISMLKESQCLLLDEPTTGLDANTSLELFRFCNVIKDMIPVFATLLQPSAELFFQFDNLVLMDEGRILYSGPTTEALPFFAKCGFVCPENKNPADFLLEMIEKLRKYKDRPAALDNPNPEPVEQYVNVNQEIDEELRNRASYNASFMLQMALNIWRGFALVKNYPWPFMIRMIKTIVVAIVYGSAYWQLGNTQADLINRISIGFSVVLFAGLASISNMGPYFEIRPVYYMQKMNYYYSPLAFFLGTLIVDLPLCMFESTIFGTIVYWMSGLKTTFQAFIFFLAVVFVLSFLILSMVRMTAFGVEIIEQAQGLIPLFIVLQLFFTGFLITYSTAWDGLAWLFWISPFNYGNQALCINELEGTTFRCTKKELMPPTNLPEFDLPFKKGGFGGQQICPVTNGEQFLESIDFKTPNEYKVYYFLVVLGMCAIFQVLAYLTMRFCYFPPPPPKGVGAMKDKEEDDPEDKSRESTGKSEAYMSWRDVSYTVEVRKSTFSLRKKKLQLLYNIDGYVKPGMMLALMGPSGAGKSTLLDVLARRKTSGKITGDILVNGKKLDTATFSHIMGYVEQQNLHIETVTVKEAILFSAYLRLSEKLSKEEKIEHAKWVLRALELDVIQDTILFQLSFEQMKRVTIGVELAADPAILFLDEPTSGLDARAAALVMQCVKNIAINSGKAVICTIHQPAEPVFRLFSDLLLLKRGGNTIYFGPIGENYSTLLEYFDRNFGEKPELMRNPADFILDMCTVTTHDFAKVYDESPEHKNAVEIIDKGIVPEGFQKPEKRNYYSASFWEQYKYLTHRAITFWWRQPQVVWGSVVINTFLGLFMGLLYYQLPHDQSGLINRTALIYLGTLLPAMSTILFIALFIGERPTYTREQSSATYHPLFYVAGIFSAHIPLNFIAVIILSSGFYFLSGLRTEGSPHYFFFLVLASTGNVMVFMAVHMVCAVAFPSIDIANGFASTIISLFGLFSGFMIRTSKIPDWWIWFHYISPQYYALEAVFANEFDGVKYGCPKNHGAYFIADPSSKSGEGRYYCPHTEGGAAIEELFDFHLDRKWQDIGILYSMAIFYLALVVVAIRYIKHINR